MARATCLTADPLTAAMWRTPGEMGKQLNRAKPAKLIPINKEAVFADFLRNLDANMKQETAAMASNTLFQILQKLLWKPSGALKRPQMKWSISLTSSRPDTIKNTAAPSVVSQSLSTVTSQMRGDRF